MNLEDRIRKQLEESAEMKRRMAGPEMVGAILEAARLVARTLEAGGTVFTLGNGGSAADAQHIATELVVRLRKGWPVPPQRVVALTTNSSLLTACANDFGYDEVFARQVAAYGRKGDLLLGISTSGASPNVIRAFEEGRARGLSCLLLTGGDGGKLASMADSSVCVPSAETNRIQEGHLALIHVICDLMEPLLLRAGG